MCGITALFKQRDFAQPLSLVRLMSDRVAHRGPDGAGMVGLRGATVTRSGESTAWQIALANRRLSIMDVSEAAAQPMVYNDRYWLTYNGEVYNFLELRAELEKFGHVFRTAGDAEVVLAAFAEWGTRCFERMRGMWSLVLVDAQEGHAVVCRDRMGIKPLYVWRGAGLLAVVSEVKQLLAIRGFRVRRSDKAVAEFLATGYEDPTCSFFSGVAPLPSGTYRTFRVGDESLSPPTSYWWPERVTASISDTGQASQAFAAKLDECVRLHVRSDVPAGCALSGGLDSSAIALIIDRHGGQETALRTFTSTCIGDPPGELQYVDAVLNGIRATPHFVTPSPNGFMDDLDDFVYHQDEPVSSLSMYAGYCVARMAREEEVPVILSGQGGDEILSGYWQSYFLYMRELGLAGRISELAKNMLGALLPDGNPTLLRQVPVMLRRYSSRRRGPSFIKGQSSSDRAVLHRTMASRGQERRLSEIRMMLTRLLRWDDRNSMAFGVETRYPFLDHGLIELCLSFAPEVLYHHGWTKWPLRLGLQDVLPDQVAHRRSKFGYWVPQDRWLCGSLRPSLAEWLSSDRPLWNLLDRTSIRRLAEKTWQLSGRRDECGQALVRCFLFDKWLEVFNVE